MTDIKDKIIADLRHELDTARAVIKVMEDNERLAEERHEHELREAKRYYGPDQPVDYPEDCEQLRLALLAIGVTVSIKGAEAFWSWRSDQWSAGWLSLPEKAVDEVRKWWPRYQAARKP